MLAAWKRSCRYAGAPHYEIYEIILLRAVNTTRLQLRTGRVFCFHTNRRIPAIYVTYIMRPYPSSHLKGDASEVQTAACLDY